MTDLTEMWTELERYQPYADRRGFGSMWRQMCEERKENVAWLVHAVAMWTENAWVEDAAYAAAYALAAVTEADAAEWAQIAINNIQKAIEEEKT